MRANVKLFFILLIFVSNFVLAQKGSNDSTFTPSPAFIRQGLMAYPKAGFLFDWETNSTTFTNNFLFDVRADKTLTKETVSNSGKKLINSNYFVNYAEGGLYYVMSLKSKPLTGIIFEASAASFQDATFGKGAFELILFGNARYRNEKKDINKVFYRNIEYQKVGVGIRQYSKHRTQCINATVDLVLGDYASELKIDRGSVFTEQNGEYLDIDLAYNRHVSSNGAKLSNPKGVGAALNLSWSNFSLSRNAVLTLELRDLGMVRYDASTESQTVDTTIHFTGIDLGAFSAVSNFSNSGIQDSVLSKFNIKKNFGAYNFSLPTSLEIKCEKAFAQSSLLQLHTKFYLRNAMPLLKVSYLYLVKNDFYIGAAVRAGGYSKFDIDLLARYRNSKLFLDAGIKSLDGLINPKQTAGLGAFLHLGLYLN